MTSTTEHRTEADTLAELATAAQKTELLIPGQLYGTVTPRGELLMTSAERFNDGPSRKRGTVQVHDAAAFVAYVQRHGSPDSEVWANARTSQLVAVLNTHREDPEDAGWGDHRVQLVLHPTSAWTAWASHDQNMLSQIDFAEHIEARLADVVAPSGAHMLELAQTFSSTRSVAFESSRRIKSGETQLVYREDEETTAGKKGDLAVPDTFTLALQPYERSDVYKVTARLRYRINGQRLALGYVLDRPEDVQRSAFDDTVNAVHTELEQPVWNGTPADPILPL